MGGRVTTGVQVDVCLILEGTYPYVSGGVSTWTHDLLRAQSDLTFHLVCLLPQHADLTLRYKLPENVLGITHIVVGGLPKGAARLGEAKGLLKRLEDPLLKLTAGGSLADVAEVLAELRPLRARLGSEVLLNSPEAWDLLLRMYRSTHGESAFLDYFWTWRTILGGLYSILLAEIPDARVYHAVSTGYAGLFAACARLKTGRPVLLTEHGIYTNERRIEIAMADWLYHASATGLQIEKPARDLKDMWVDTFISYSHASYEAASRILTLYCGNQQYQVEDGAQPEKLGVIPNGIDFERYSAAALNRGAHPPTVALIGRVVPIKDVKTYIRAIAIVRDAVPDVQALLLGPTDEDPRYFAECQNLVHHLGLQNYFTFAGPVQVADYLGRLDAVVLTSISEAQPLVILEAGAAGVPSVVTDVGACREMIYGDRREKELLGAGGEVTPLANPTATAHALVRLLTDPAHWDRSSRAIRERVRKYYDKPALDCAYRELYEHWGAQATASAFMKAAV